MDGKSGWQSAMDFCRQDASFTIPPRPSAAIRIVDPSSRITSSARTPNLSNGTKHERSVQAVDIPDKNSTAKKTAVEGVTESISSLDAHHGISPISNEPPLLGPVHHGRSLLQFAQDPPTTVPNAFQSRLPRPLQISKLDIHATIHVPQWLTAVNESPAATCMCQPLAVIDFADYVVNFAGRRFLSPQVLAPLPLLSPVRQTLDVEHAKLQESEYGQYFQERLQNLFVVQAESLRGCWMYNTVVEAHDLSQQLFRLTISGMREHSPRIDLGDVIILRPIIPMPEQRAMFEATTWTQPGGGRDRGDRFRVFYGTEFRAFVRGLDRQKEQILLRIDGYPVGLVFRSNIMFAIQTHWCSPIWNSVSRISDIFASSANGSLFDPEWLRSMLFPDVTHGIQQKSLPRGSFNLKWYDEILNYEQQKAVDAVVTNNYGCVPYLISGPPGTGKTKTIVEVALQLVLRSTEDGQPKPHLLICAPSDPAADTLVSRLSKHLTPTQMFRLNGYTRTTAEVPGNVLIYSYHENDLFSLPEFGVMMKFDVVVTTCRDANMLLEAQLTNQALAKLAFETMSLVAPSATIALKKVLHWTALLLDEAGQAIEPEALIPLRVVIPPAFSSSKISDGDSSLIPQFVLAGDEHQLGPRLPVGAPAGLQVSLFERLFTRSFYAAHPLSRSKAHRPLTAAMLPIIRPPFTNLIRNYRSHPAILAVPSTLFYSDTLIPESRKTSKLVARWPGWASPIHLPVLFRVNSSPDFVESVLTGSGTGVGGVYNTQEAKDALNVTQALLTYSSQGKAIQQNEIMIMSPFRAQVIKLRQLFRSAGLFDVNIGALEVFQGLESRIVIFCTTRTRLGPRGQEQKYVMEDRGRGLGVIDERKRFNVAITRAKEGLIVIGNPACLLCTKDPNWTAFLGFCERNGCVSTATSGRAAQLVENAGEMHVGRLERALQYAHEARMREKAVKEQQRNSFHSRNSSANTLKLRGNMPTSDEQMWATGMELAELAVHVEIEQDSGELDVDGDDAYVKHHSEDTEEDVNTQSDKEVLDNLPESSDRGTPLPGERESGGSRAGGHRKGPELAESGLAGLSRNDAPAQKHQRNASGGAEFDRDLQAEIEREGSSCATQ